MLVLGKRSVYALFLLIGLMFPAITVADEDGPQRSYVKASALGSVYAKCFPEAVITGEGGETKGRTEVFRMTDQGEVPRCSFAWYVDQIYLADNLNPDGEDPILVKIGAWPRGISPDEQWLAIAFYKGCREIKRYSTADIVRLGYKDPQNVSRSVSHYTVLREVKGFRALASREYAFDVVTHEGTVLSFDASTGALRTAAEEDQDYEQQRQFLKRMCDMSQGSLVEEAKEGVPHWICKASGGITNFGPVLYYEK